MRRNIFAFLLITTFLLQLAFAQSVSKITPAERKIAEGVTAKQLSDYLYFVASDAMAGRDTPSQGLDATAEFLKMNLSKWGFKPAGDNDTFFQKIAIKSEATDPANNTLQVAGQNFTYGDDYFRLSGNGSLNGPLVFVRDGWMVKSKGIDAYKGVDVHNKIVVVYGQGFPRASSATNPPAGVGQDDLKGIKGTDWADPLTYAVNSGAKGIILIASPQAQGAWVQIRNFLGRSNSYPEKLHDTQPDFPIMLVSSKVGDAMFAGEPANKDATQSFALNKSATMSVAAKAEIKWTQNVVAVWEGSDPILKNEMVAIGAHYDHVGDGPRCRPVNGDNICNGADDDGSGTVAVLSIAEALAKAAKRPKRSVLFVWHAGEEKGLWGAEYFNKFPTVDIKEVITQLNIDMIGRSRKAGDANPKNKDLTDENSTYVIGSEVMSSTLGSVVKQANAGFLNLRYDYKYDDPKDPEQFFFRSDHFHYAVNGIPIAFWFSGVHEDYHQPGDEAHKIDYNKMEKIARTIFVTLLKLADLKERPKIDKQLPPELTQR